MTDFHQIYPMANPAAALGWIVFSIALSGAIWRHSAHLASGIFRDAWRATALACLLGVFVDSAGSEWQVLSVSGTLVNWLASNATGVMIFLVAYGLFFCFSFLILLPILEARMSRENRHAS